MDANLRLDSRAISDEIFLGSTLRVTRSVSPKAQVLEPSIGRIEAGECRGAPEAEAARIQPVVSQGLDIRPNPSDLLGGPQVPIPKHTHTLLRPEVDQRRASL